MICYVSGVKRRSSSSSAPGKKCRDDRDNAVLANLEVSLVDFKGFTIWQHILQQFSNISISSSYDIEYNEYNIYIYIYISYVILCTSEDPSASSIHTYSDWLEERFTSAMPTRKQRHWG